MDSERANQTRELVRKLGALSHEDQVDALFDLDDQAREELEEFLIDGSPESGEDGLSVRAPVKPRPLVNSGSRAIPRPDGTPH